MENNKKTLTGRFFHKKTLFGLVLMVEESQKKNIGGSFVFLDDVLIVRKATEKDLLDLKLNNNT